MCGLVGIIGKDSPADRTLLQAMNETIRHRGPDGEGEFFDRNIGLAHRRLSIQDPAHHADQPMIRNGLVIVFNGEIYNFKDLRQDLVSKGHHFDTGSDTEVILAAYREWGEDCVARFRGMWAFAIYDQEHHKIFLSRDRFGIKPLYFHEDEGRFTFASEIKALLRGIDRPQANIKTVSKYLVTGYQQDTQETFFKDIFQLPASHNLIIDTREFGYRFNHYYDLADSIKPSTPEEVIDAVRESIRYHMVSDVEVGSCLSGGLDSSVISAIAAKQANPFVTVTAKSIDPKNDESHLAEMVARHIGSKLEISEPNEDDLKSGLEKCLYFQEEPVTSLSVFMQYDVMKAASECHLKVMLDGQGGDEAFLGYERYYVNHLAHLVAQGKILSFLKSFMRSSQNSKLSKRTLLQFYAYFSSARIRKMALKRRHKHIHRRFLELGTEELPVFSSNILDLQLSEIGTYQLPHLLKYEDRNSMAHAVESRVPFVDHVLLEKVLSLPFDQKVRDGYTKYPLRMLASEVLPEEIAWRKIKFGFEAPESKLLPIIFRKYRDQVENSELLGFFCDRPQDHMSWRFVNLAIWEKQFSVGIP